MFNFNKNLEEFYSEYIDKELYKTKFTLVKAPNFNKLIFLDKVNRSSYWFPLGSGRLSLEESNKMRLKKRFSRSSTYNFDGFTFLSSFEVFLNSKFNISVLEVFNTPLFLNYISMMNELLRKQELKKNTQDVRMYSVSSWKYKHYNKYSVYKYYYNFEPHRNLIRIRKFNFIAVYSWMPVKRWLFTYRNMRNYYLKWRKTQKFEFKFYRGPGMSFRYWAKQQLQFNYLNSNSSDFLSDPYSSNIFMPSQVPATQEEVLYQFSSPQYNYLHASFVYWIFIQIKSNMYVNSLASYFSNSYNFNQTSTSTKHKFLKNFFSYNTPKQAHVFYGKLDDAYGGWSELRNYFSFFKPSYWNLKKGLDSYPHEHWAWEDVLWWEDHVPLFFSRFTEKRREERFLDLDFIDSANFHWFYKTWFHEEIFTEMHASYYRTYYNIDYLTPGWRISTDFPKKKMGHFDPKWQERLQEYVIYPYMNLFYPSTKRYYIDYFNHPDYVDSRSFLALNFAWKLNKLSPFFYKPRPKFRKVIRSFSELQVQLDKFKPQFSFFLDNYSSISFFPAEFLNLKTQQVFEAYLTNLTFLVNIFTKNHNLVSPTNQNLEYLFSYLSIFYALSLNKKDFISVLTKNSSTSYSDLLNLLEQILFLPTNELFFHRERIVAEYVAFKRFYSLLISKSSNIK